MKLHCLRRSGLVVLSALTVLSCFSSAQTGCNLTWASNCSQQLGGPAPPLCPNGSGNTCSLAITSTTVGNGMTVQLGQPNGGGSSVYCIDNSSNAVTVQWSEGTAMDTFIVAFNQTPFSNVTFSGGVGLPASGTTTATAGGCYEFLVVNCSSTQCAWADPRLVIKGGGGGGTAIPPHGGKGK
jgi:hypothetical protein